MKSRLTNCPRLVCLIVVVGLFCASCENKSSSEALDATSKSPAYTPVEISTTPTADTPLYMKPDGRVRWTNSSGLPVFVCFDPNYSPFEAYAWDIPASNGGKKGVRETGKIRADAVPTHPIPKDGYLFPYTTSPTPCALPPPPPCPPGSGSDSCPNVPLTSPHIIIRP
jgi:hypothetical protein